MDRALSKTMVGAIHRAPTHQDLRHTESVFFIRIRKLNCIIVPLHALFFICFLFAVHSNKRKRGLGMRSLYGSFAQITHQIPHNNSIASDGPCRMTLLYTCLRCKSLNRLMIHVSSGHK